MAQRLHPQRPNMLPASLPRSFHPRVSGYTTILLEIPEPLHSTSSHMSAQQVLDHTSRGGNYLRVPIHPARSKVENQNFAESAIKIFGLAGARS